MWVSCRVKCDSHTLTESVFRLFQLDALNIRISDVKECSFLLSVKSLDGSASEAVQIHDCHRVICALLISLNVGSIGLFYWATDPFIHPVLLVTDELNEKKGRAASLVVHSQTADEMRKPLAEEDVENAMKIFGIVARERSQVLTGEYCRGLLLLRMNFVELNFRREAFMCFYRALEHFAAVRILKVKRLSNELKDLQRAVGTLTSDSELLDELRVVYSIRSSQGAHSQGLQRDITFDEVRKMKVFLDFVMHKEFKSEAHRELARRTSEAP